MHWDRAAFDGSLRAETGVATLTIYSCEPPFWWVVRRHGTSFTKPPDAEGFADTVEQAKAAAEQALGRLVRR